MTQLCWLDWYVRRALGWHLLSCKGRAEMDAQQWEQDATEKQQKVAELEQDVQKVQQELEERVNSFKVCWHGNVACLHTQWGCTAMLSTLRRCCLTCRLAALASKWAHVPI
jgi:hypothetical protein